MIHEAKCNIVVQTSPFRQEPPIPSDAEIEELFPDWKAKAGIFIGRCIQEEGKTNISSNDLFRYGMKFMICEAKKLV
jgi:hypothetical protein